MPTSPLKHRLLSAAFACGLLAVGATAATAKGLNGMWVMKEGDFQRADATPPPLAPAFVAAQAAAQKAHDEDPAQALNPNAGKCLPHGMPGMMVNEFAIEFLETPGRVTILNESATLPRSVYLTDKHNGDVLPTYNGHSIGHWQGGSLVIDTIALNDKTRVGRGAPASGTTHIVERYTPSADGKTMEGEMTFEDPNVLTKPWVVKHSYERLPDDAPLWEYPCEPEDVAWRERFAGDPQAKSLAH